MLPDRSSGGMNERTFFENLLCVGYTGFFTSIISVNLTTTTVFVDENADVCPFFDSRVLTQAFPF